MFQHLTVSTEATLSTVDPKDCFMENEECRGKHLKSFAGITSPQQCSTLCQQHNNHINYNECHGFTHYDLDSFPFSEMCVLFRECLLRDPCTNCLTGSSQTDCTCGTRFHGVINADNFVGLISDFTYFNSPAEESYCKARCISNINCNAYTYYDYKINATSGSKCVLLSHLNKLVPCDSCMSGSEKFYFSNSTLLPPTTPPTKPPTKPIPTTTMEYQTTDISTNTDSHAMSNNLAPLLNVDFIFFLVV